MPLTSWSWRLFLVVILLSCSGVAPAQIPSAIQVFMPGGGTPAAGIRLTLIRDDGYVDTVFTDSKGKYDMRTPTNQTLYTVTIESDGRTYDTTTAVFTMQANNPAYLTIFLKPLSGKKSPLPEVLDVTNFEGNIPKQASVAYKRAMTSVSTGRLEIAIGELQQAISDYPQYVRAYNDLGVIYMKLDRLDEAAATFKKAIEISKRFFYPRMNLGLVLNRQNKFKEAVDVLGPLYEENHGIVEVRLAYANALSGAGETSQAEKIFRSLIESKEIAPQAKAGLHFKLGVVLNKQGKFAEAVTELEKAVALNPEAPNPHLQLGGALLQVQQFERAEWELLRAYQLSGNSSPGAQLLLGHVYYAQKRFPDAQRAFEQYLKEMPSAPNAAQITHLIAELKAVPKN
ncbi:MAG TPA: tetratricopeptide repeat protein [Pyrinomonadaceae bacterium]|nr:tetratricopeptide repeat protein [Pyrinomonadaceae bacterium]